MRPPWNPDFGPDWTRSQIAQLRYDGNTGTRLLHYRDSRERWHLYEGPGSTPDVATLLTEVDADPTGIFWS